MVSLETGIRYALTDNLDGSNPITGEFQNDTFAKHGSKYNKDWHVFTGLSFSYTFGQIPCYCKERNDWREQFTETSPLSRTGTADGRNRKGKIVYLGTATEQKPSTKWLKLLHVYKLDTLPFPFSTENWNRPKLEVSTLMDLLIKALRRELNKMIKNNIQLRSIGDISKLPTEVEKELLETIEKTSQNTGMILTLALNYGAHQRAYPCRSSNCSQS